MTGAFVSHVLRSGYRSARVFGNRVTTASLSHAIRLRGDARVFVFLGMRRSGNHLVINWMKKQADGPVVFYNNIGLDEDPLARQRREFRFGGFGPSRMILSYEDLTPEEVMTSPLVPVLRRFAGDRPGGVTVVAMLRDPYNNFASRAQRWPEGLHDPRFRAHWRALYHSFADLFLAGSLPEDLSPEGLARPLPLVTVLYNEFVSSRPYRERVAKTLGLPFTDRGVDEVPDFGMGSSFDGFADSAAKLRVFDRWRSWREDPDFQKLMDDEALLEKANRIFGRYMPSVEFPGPVR